MLSSWELEARVMLLERLNKLFMLMAFYLKYDVVTLDLD